MRLLVCHADRGSSRFAVRAGGERNAAGRRCFEVFVDLRKIGWLKFGTCDAQRFLNPFLLAVEAYEGVINSRKAQRECG